MADAIAHAGRRLSLSAWSRKTGLAAAVIADRLARGWTAERALTTPPRRRRRIHPASGRRFRP